MLNNLFSYYFWFKSSVLLGSSVKVFMVVIGFLVVVGIFSRIMIATKKKNIPLVRFFRKLSVFVFTMAFIGLFILFLNREQIPLMSNRFWFLLWSVGFIVWLIIVLKYLFVHAPRLRRQLNEKNEFEKYLP